jgi:hypothetical protein
MKVIGHVLHPVTVVADAEVALLEDVKPRVQLQNAGLPIAKELGLERKPHLTNGLHHFPNNLVDLAERVLRIHVTMMLSNLAQQVGASVTSKRTWSSKA